MMGRSQKMGGSEKDVHYCVGNGEPLKDCKQKRNIGVTSQKAEVWKMD